MVACAKSINEAIDASVNFEKLMDQIDFNSYLPGDTSSKLSTSSGYKTYKEQIREAEKEIKKGLKIVWKNKIVTDLFNAKALRLKSRQVLERKEEKNLLFSAISELNHAFTFIMPEDFKDDPGDSIYEKQNWAKVLLYNEMAICYSGLVESSISLGYADRSTRLLKHLISKMGSQRKNSNRILLLYTFALYNKGEAERNLLDPEQAVKTFQEIFEIYDTHQQLMTENSADYYSTHLRLAIILLDYGRGKEAVKHLDKLAELKLTDYRFHEARLEKANAFIDMKMYPKALSILDKYLRKTSDWKETFAQRKAKVTDLRLVIEFMKNRSKDFKTKSDSFSKVIVAKANKFEKEAKELLDNCVKRHDPDNFKKTCNRFADYFHEKKQVSLNVQESQKNWLLELRYYHLYLCSTILFEEEQKILDKLNKNSDEVVSNWINEDLEKIIDTYEEKFELHTYIEKISDENYLKGFFYTYINFEEYGKEFKPKIKLEIIEELKNCLVRLFREKGNLSEEQKIQEAYEIFYEKTDEKKTPKKEDNAVYFIDNYILKEKTSVGEKSCLNPDSILEKMEKNTKNFACNVVGRTKRFPKEKRFRALLTVLRRWNSFTPVLTSSINPSKGGGYFLYFSYKDEARGIVIDPGYDFLENLLSTGYRIGDINAVLISHAHPDHTDSLPSILSLFHEANGRLGNYFHKNFFDKNFFNKKHLKLILSQGVFDQYYEGFIKPSHESLEDVIVVKPATDSLKLEPCYKDTLCNGKYSITVEAFPTRHGDLMKWESLGFIISIKEKGKNTVRKIGYTSDAHWSNEFSKYFDKCNIICAHLGSIIDVLSGENLCCLCRHYEPEDNKKKECKRYHDCQLDNFSNRTTNEEKMLDQTHSQSHLYLSGITLLFGKLLKSKDFELAIISEFGEELKGGIRIDLYNKFNDWFRNKGKKELKCVPGDIGLEIDLMNNKIFCTSCQEFKPKEKMLPIAYGKEEAIFYVCDECRAVLSPYQIGQEMDCYHENGRKLELFDESKGT